MSHLFNRMVGPYNQGMNVLGIPLQASSFRDMAGQIGQIRSGAYQLPAPVSQAIGGNANAPVFANSGLTEAFRQILAHASSMNTLSQAQAPAASPQMGGNSFIETLRQQLQQGNKP